MRRAMPFLLLAALPIACNRGSAPAVVTGPKSTPGWEVRYNAAVALARRGSASVLEDPAKESILQMLDEDQQMRNFRETVNGKEISDAGKAQLTVITAVQALADLHQRKPDLDLSPFKSAIDKLVNSPSLAVSTEAKKTQLLLAAK
jgi:hypothetical protein